VRVAYFGTSRFAVPALEKLASSRHDLVAAVCPPPAPQGRGRKLVPCPVESRSRELGVAVLAPSDPNDSGFLQELRNLSPDIGVLAAYGYILHSALLGLPPGGFINIHPSLLPRYRGAAPVLRCLLDGADRTGVCVIRMSRQVDAGPVLASAEVAVDPDENRGELEARLAETGAQLASDVLDRLEAGTAEVRPQDSAHATTAPKLRPEERRLNWKEPARAVHNRVRALAPEPGAWTELRSRRLLVLRSRIVDEPSTAGPGELQLDLPGLAAGTGEGLLELVEVKPESGRVQSGRDLRNGLRLESDEKLE